MIAIAVEAGNGRSKKLKTVNGELSTNTRNQNNPVIATNLKAFMDLATGLRAPRFKITPVRLVIERANKVLSREELMSLVVLVKE